MLILCEMYLFAMQNGNIYMLLIHRPQDGEIDYTCSRSKASFLENVDILWIIPIGMLLPIGMIVFVYNE